MGPLVAPLVGSNSLSFALCVLQDFVVNPMPDRRSHNFSIRRFGSRGFSDSISAISMHCQRRYDYECLVRIARIEFATPHFQFARVLPSMLC